MRLNGINNTSQVRALRFSAAWEPSDGQAGLLKANGYKPEDVKSQQDYDLIVTAIREGDTASGKLEGELAQRGINVKELPPGTHAGQVLGLYKAKEKLTGYKAHWQSIVAVNQAASLPGATIALYQEVPVVVKLDDPTFKKSNPIMIRRFMDPNQASAGIFTGPSMSSVKTPTAKQVEEARAEIARRNVQISNKSLKLGHPVVYSHQGFASQCTVKKILEDVGLVQLSPVVAGQKPFMAVPDELTT